MKYVSAIAIAFFVAIVSATGQQVAEDTSANAVFLGCKAFVEDRATNARSINIAGVCAGVVHGLSSVAQYLTPPESAVLSHDLDVAVYRSPLLSVT